MTSVPRKPPAATTFPPALDLAVFRQMADMSSEAFFLTDARGGGVPSTVLHLARAFQSTSSFYDTGVEWLLALGCVLALSERVSGEPGGVPKGARTA